MTEARAGAIFAFLDGCNRECRAWLNPADYDLVRRHGAKRFEMYTQAVLLKMGWMGETLAGQKVGASRSVAVGHVVFTPMGWSSAKLGESLPLSGESDGKSA